MAQYNTRIFLWKNLYLFLGDKFGKKYGKLFVKVLGQRVVSNSHSSFHKNFSREIWIVEPAFYQLRAKFFYSAVALSLLAAAFLSLFWVLLPPQLDRNLLY
jgi:hypothetical protein